MKFPRTSGTKRKGKATAGLPFDDVSLGDIDRAATKSLRGEGKNRMTPTYGKKRFNGKPPTRP